MKRIDKAELYRHLSGFLKAKGIELTEGSYAVGIKKSCSFLADAINLSQQGLERARTQVDKNVDKLRQVIHEKTAPQPTAARAPAPAPTAAPAETSATKAKVTASRPRPRSKGQNGKRRG
ncbi:MAG TPA: hypothetical protein VNZ64_01070 [Candidatus Acidoferrum sp.]|jgi:hypothetical protein|nr:hypothetical protein [Candidatus Acidoferrum sp.]